jgi:ParB family chromosome partitioning protein
VTKRGLGKGLRALIPPTPLMEEKEGDIQWLELTQIKPNQNQPRRSMDQAKLEELAESIKEYGVVQPIIVRATKNQKYEIVAGERRWRACRLADLERIPAIIRKYDGSEVSEIALIENIQRENLNPVEEAQAYKMLVEEYRITQSELSKKIGRSRPYIANTLRLLNLPDEILEMLSQGLISPGHARALLSIENAEAQTSLAKRIVNEKLSVRQAESLLATKESHEAITEAEQKGKSPGKKKDLLKEDYLLSEVEDRLEAYLGTRVNIRYKSGKGKVEIDYYTDEDLERIIGLMMIEEG